MKDILEQMEVDIRQQPLKDLGRFWIIFARMFTTIFTDLEKELPKEFSGTERRRGA